MPRIYLSKKQIEDWIQKHFHIMRNYMYSYLTDMDSDAYPELIINAGDRSYATGDSRTICIGLGMFMYQTEEELSATCMYLIGHEVQHILSTTSRDWNFALQRGTEIIIEAISKKDKTGNWKFRNTNDYGRFMKHLNEEGILINRNQIMEICHYIINSVEDGRIERIRSIIHTGFKKYMIGFRGKYWEESPVDKKSPELDVILGQIYWLSTVQMYQKGYTSMYADNPTVVDTMKKLIPHIREGVNAPTCKEGMLAGLRLIEAVSDMIADRCTMPKEFVELLKTFEQIVEKLKEDGLLNDAETDAKRIFADEKTEETSDGKMCPFEQSELDRENKPTEKSESEQEEQNQERNQSDKVEKAVEKAKKEQKKEVERVKEQAERMSRCLDDTNTDTLPPSTEDINANYKDPMDFKEVFRNYPLDMPLPYDIANKSRLFAKEIEEYFIAKSTPTCRYRTSGLIDAKNIHKLGMNQIDFFLKKEKKDTETYCSYFLVDNSGSMGDGKNSKREYAHSAMAVIEKGFSFMPMKIVAFDSRGKQVVHDVVKNWEERLEHSGSYNFLNHGNSGSSNTDGYSIRVATKELMARNEKNKLLFILSDGTPSGYNASKEDVTLAVELARKQGIKVCSIYFSMGTISQKEEEEFVSMYKKNCICTNARDISRELLAIMKKFIQ